MRIERMLKITTRQEAEKNDLEYWRNLTPDQRLAHQLEIIHAWTTPDQRRLERIVEIVSVPQR